MTLKQQKFADEYLVSGNATKAALKAGYSKKSAYSIGAENLKKPVIAAYIKKRQQELENSKIAQQQEVLEYLSAVMRGEPSRSISSTNGVVESPVSIKDRLSAAKELLKRNPFDPLIKAQTDKAIAEAKIATAQAEEVNHLTDATMKLMADLSTEDLTRLAHLGDSNDEVK